MFTVFPTDRIFILAGAGVSAKSGVPTFRGVGGLGQNYRIEEVALPEAWHRDPRLVWEFYSMRRRVASEAAKKRLLTVYCDQLRVSSRF
jgi:NAD-dependent deacetylase